MMCVADTAQVDTQTETHVSPKQVCEISTYMPGLEYSFLHIIEGVLLVSHYDRDR